MSVIQDDVLTRANVTFPDFSDPECCDLTGRSTVRRVDGSAVDAGDDALEDSDGVGGLHLNFEPVRATVDGDPELLTRQAWSQGAHSDDDYRNLSHLRVFCRVIRIHNS
jgi:hypothetical protein